MTPIPKGTISCVVRVGEERKEILRSTAPEQTREDVVSGLHGMGVFRLDYVGQKWMLGHELLTVDVDIERVTAPPEVPKEVSAEQLSSDAPTDLPADLAHEIVAIHSRVDFIKKAVGAYTYVATQAMKQKFGVAGHAGHISREELVRTTEHLRDLVIALPELYLWTHPSCSDGVDAETLDNCPDDCRFDSHVPSYEKLRERLGAQSLVIVGGVPITQRLDELEAVLGARPEWPETTQDGNTRVADSIERRIRDGKIAAVIIAHDLIRHRTFYAVRDAAAKHGVPIAYASKAGIGKLRRALGQIEDMLRQKQEDAELPF